MNEVEPHAPHWTAGAATHEALSNEADAERLAHMAYGKLVKNFGLGTTHTFSSWNDLPESERGKWVAAMVELQAEIRERQQPAGQPPSQSH